MNHLAAVATAVALAVPLLCGAEPNTAAEPKPPQTVALLAAIGDRIEFVRQRESVGSNIEPYTRQTLQVSSQALNYAVLRGLDKAIGEEEPASTRVLLQWTMPAALADQVEKARGAQRQDLVLGALTEHLRNLPARQGWDRVEVIVPAYTFLEMKGLGTKLSGIGIYVQPLARTSIDISGLTDGSTEMNVSSTETDGDYRTVNPTTGETAHSSVYVAPYMYFERLTYDAKSLALLKRQRFFDNTKYADPMSTALDVSQQMTPQQMMGKLLESVEKSAYKSVRPLTSEVTMTVPKLVTPTPSPAASAPR